MNDSFTTERKTKYPYTNIGNKIFNTKGLSAKSVGLFCYLISLPSGWQVYISQLSKHFSDGETSIKSGLKELKEFGFIETSQQKDSNGQWLPMKYTFVENPDVVEREIDERLAAERLTPNPSLISTNKTNTNIHNTKNSTHTGTTRRGLVKRNEQFQNDTKKKSKVEQFVNKKYDIAAKFDFSESVMEKLTDFCSMLAEGGTFLPDISYESQLKKLKELSDKKQYEAVDYTITQGWKSLVYAVEKSSQVNLPSFDTARKSKNQLKTNEEKRMPLVGETF